MRAGEQGALLVDAIQDFVGVEAPPPDIETILSTVLFTDIVDSTVKQAALSDNTWKELVEGHHATVRRSLERWRGTEMDTAGDGFYATFDGPARANPVRPGDRRARPNELRDRAASRHTHR